MREFLEDWGALIVVVLAIVLVVGAVALGERASRKEAERLARIVGACHLRGYDDYDRAAEACYRRIYEPQSGAVPRQERE